MRSSCPFAGMLLLAAALSALASPASAEVSAEDKQKARAAYERGAEASARGDHATAARELALADALAPNLVALETALEAAIEAKDAPLGMELAARAEARGEGGKSAELARRARATFASLVGRVKILCSGPTPCSASLDGAPVRISEERFVTPGKHVVAVRSGNGTEERTLEVKAGTLEIFGGAGPPEPPQGPLVKSPVWFGVMAGVTAVLIGGAVLSGVDTQNQHADFVAARCPEPNPAPTCAGLAEAGADAQLRTNLFLGVIALGAATTTFLGFATFRGRNHAPASSLSIEPGKDRLFARLIVALP